MRFAANLLVNNVRRGGEMKRGEERGKKRREESRKKEKGDHKL
jgi:hypothetical protein